MSGDITTDYEGDRPAPTPAAAAEESLSPLEQSRLAETERGLKALRIIVRLIADNRALAAQCQRDYQLAAEWKERYESARTDAEVLRTRLENPNK